MKHAMVVYGTRPETIKLAPVVQKLKKSKHFRTTLVVTAQHREMLDQMNRVFGLKPDVDLDLMRERQTLWDMTAVVIEKMVAVYRSTQPDVVIVQGDTTTAFVSALAAFYLKIPVAHVEAGLRSGNIYSPFPEEVNRRLIGVVTSYHFAPTERARQNLFHEGIRENVWVTGNTVVDALLWLTEAKEHLLDECFRKLLNGTSDAGKIVLLTMHRRENWGEPMRRVFQMLKDLLLRRNDLLLVYPVHPNPVVRDLAHEIFQGVKNALLTSPLDYPTLVSVMMNAHLIMTDSGGIQEEAPTFKKPVLVLRDTTERPELIESGAGKLVGTDPSVILEELEKLLDDKAYYERFRATENPFGDGKASERIVDILEKKISE